MHFVVEKRSMQTDERAAVDSVGAPISRRQRTATDMNMKSRTPADRHAGCRLFVAPSGRAGFALGTEARRAAWLYDFFAAPREEIAAAGLMNLAVKQGARQLITYDHPFLVGFFSQFGFRPRVRAQLAQLKDPPAEWIPTHLSSGSAPTNCPDFLLMLRVADAAAEASPAIRDTLGALPAAGEPYFQETLCAACGGNVASRLRWLGVLDGYQCPHCRLVRVAGTLTLAPWDGAASKSVLARLTGWQPARGVDAMLFTSGADFLLDD
jgi:hypothetical protein